MLPPLVTFCKWIEICGKRNHDTLQNILHCYQNSTGDIIWNNLTKIDIIESVEVDNGASAETYVTKSFNKMYGPCETLHVKAQLKKEKYVEILISNNVQGFVRAVLHDLNDLPIGTNPKLWFLPQQNRSTDVYLRKKIVTSESTRRSPCGKQYEEVCKAIEDIKLIQNQLKCYSPLLYSGPHLDEFVDKTLPKCSLEQVQQALNQMNEKKSYENCPEWDKCQKVRYQIASKQTLLVNGTYLWIAYEDTETEHHLNYVSYDVFNLVGEIGGYLGLTLGLSGASIISALRQFM